MYKWLIVLLIFSSCKQVAKHQTAKAPHAIVVDGKKINDADLLGHEEKKGTHYVVFIEHDRHSPRYKVLSDFKPDSSEDADYKQNYGYLKKTATAKFKTFNLAGLPKEWMPLYLYKGKYYIYFPSEWGVTDKRIITDSTVVYWPMDGPTPESILATSKTGNNTWNFTTHCYYDKRPRHIAIHIIDPKNEVAVWENLLETSENHYRLYVSRENAKNYDMIVSYCEEHKTGEFIFDKVDYTALLKGK